MKQLRDLFRDQIPNSLSLFPTIPLSPLPLPPENGCRLRYAQLPSKSQNQDSAQTEELKLATEPQTAREPLPGERWPILRPAESDRSVPGWLWHSVADRDDWTCRICHNDKPRCHWEIDHIIPWSAGGSDDSTNLRLTCARCNQRRGNYFDPFAQPMPPVVFPCINRYAEPGDIRVWCASHKRWENMPRDYAIAHELAAYIQAKALWQARAQEESA